MAAMSARQSRAAESTSVSSTACRSKAERLMTLSTSDVAVCCSSDLLRSWVRWRSSLSSRVFSIRDDRLGGELLHQLDLLVRERPHLLAVDADRADQVVFLEHRNDQQGSRARQIGETPARLLRL